MMNFFKRLTPAQKAKKQIVLHNEGLYNAQKDEAYAKHQCAFYVSEINRLQTIVDLSDDTPLSVGKLEIQNFMESPNNT